jgi:hypothetical protein
MPGIAADAIQIEVLGQLVSHMNLLHAAELTTIRPGREIGSGRTAIACALIK